MSNACDIESSNIIKGIYDISFHFKGTEKGMMKTKTVKA